MLAVPTQRKLQVSLWIMQRDAPLRCQKLDDLFAVIGQGKMADVLGDTLCHGDRLQAGEVSAGHQAADTRFYGLRIDSSTAAGHNVDLSRISA
ncbi:hypothetical protein DBV23_18135 [Edwardsiella ictaluri]|nr:hypothetical protein DBV23_18135 [Edwardsiella ictaluri]